MNLEMLNKSGTVSFMVKRVSVMRFDQICYDYYTLKGLLASYYQMHFLLFLVLTCILCDPITSGQLHAQV